MGFRRFRVVGRTVESADVTSFDLAPADGEAMWRARPGQYLTLRVPTVDGPVLRTYSISTDAARSDATRISVKRETGPASATGAPAGTGSGWLHDAVAPGAEIEIAAPRGDFALDVASERPVVLLSGGIGQTPLLSMLHALARGTRSAWYLHACENGEVHALHAEVRGLVAGAGGRLRHHVAYRTPTEADRARGGFDAEGLIDRATLQALLPIDDYDCYLCGPTPFMVAQYRLLTGLGVPAERIRHEFFGEGASLEVLARRDAEAEVAGAVAAPARRAGSRAPAALAGLAHLTDPDARAAHDGDGIATADRAGPTSRSNATNAATPTTGTAVVFARSGVEAVWTDAAGSLLELAEGAGLAPPFSCRSGICNTCLCTLVEGTVEYLEEPLLVPAPGTALICCSRPAGKVVLAL